MYYRNRSTSMMCGLIVKKSSVLAHLVTSSSTPSILLQVLYAVYKYCTISSCTYLYCNTYFMTTITASIIYTSEAIQKIRESNIFKSTNANIRIAKTEFCFDWFDSFAHIDWAWPNRVSAKTTTHATSTEATMNMTMTMTMTMKARLFLNYRVWTRVSMASS